MCVHHGAIHMAPQPYQYYGAEVAFHNATGRYALHHHHFAGDIMLQGNYDYEPKPRQRQVKMERKQ